MKPSTKLLTLVGAAGLTGLASGLALATREMTRFSPVSDPWGFGIIFLAGIGLGALSRNFARLLIAILLVLLVAGTIMTLALIYPEMDPEALLGVGAAFSMALRKAVVNIFFFVLPLTLIGAMLGRIFSRHDHDHH